MTVMLKSDFSGQEAEQRLEKVVDVVGDLPDIPLGHLTSGTGLSRGMVYVLTKSTECDHWPRPASWDIDTFISGGSGYELIGAISGVKAPKGEVITTGWSKHRAQDKTSLAEEHYPDLDIAGIVSRGRELRKCATDSAAVSRVVDKPVQIVHQPE